MVWRGRFARAVHFSREILLGSIVPEGVAISVAAIFRGIPYPTPLNGIIGLARHKYI
jgi:hypothetical protein